MHTRDYALLARNIKRQVNLSDESTSQGFGAKYALKKLAYALCVDLAMENPRFDTDKFLKECGLVKD